MIKLLIDQYHTSIALRCCAIYIYRINIHIRFNRKGDRVGGRYPILRVSNPSPTSTTACIKETSYPRRNILLPSFLENYLTFTV